MPDFFGPLVDQQYHQFRFRMVFRDALTDMLHHDRLTASRRRDNQRPLSFTHRCQQIHHARGQRHCSCLKRVPLLGVDRRQLIERLDLWVFLWIKAINIGQLA